MLVLLVLLELGRRTEEAAVGTHRKVAEGDSRLDCAEKPGGGLGCNSRLMTLCLNILS